MRRGALEDAEGKRLTLGVSGFSSESGQPSSPQNILMRVK